MHAFCSSCITSGMMHDMDPGRQASLCGVKMELAWVLLYHQPVQMQCFTEVHQRRYTISQQNHPPTHQPQLSLSLPLQDLRSDLELNFALNSKAFLIEHSADLVEFVGNRTECALLMLGRKWGGDYKALRDQHTPNVAHVSGIGCIKPGLVQRQALVRCDWPRQMH